MSETKLHDLRGFKAAIARMESIDPPVASPEHELLAVAKWVYEVLDPSPAPAVAERGEPKFIHDDIVSLDGNKKGWVVIDYSFDGEFRYRLMGHDPMGWIAESRLNLLHRKKDLTPKEADRAYDEAPADPISDAEIKRHLAACGINMEPAKERLRAMMAKAREQTPAEPAPSEGESTEQELNMLLHRLWTKAATEASDSYDKQEWLRLEKLLATKPAGMKVFFDGIPADAHHEMCRQRGEIERLTARDNEWFWAAKKALASMFDGSYGANGTQTVEDDPQPLYEMIRGRGCTDTPEPVVAQLLAELAAARKRAEEAEGLLVQVYEQVGNGAAPSRRHALTPGLRDAIRDVLRSIPGRGLNRLPPVSGGSVAADDVGDVLHDDGALADSSVGPIESQ